MSFPAASFLHPPFPCSSFYRTSSRENRHFPQPPPHPNQHPGNGLSTVLPILPPSGRVQQNRPFHHFHSRGRAEHLLCTLQGWSQTQLGSVINMQSGGCPDCRVPGTEEGLQIKLNMAALTPQQEDQKLNKALLQFPSKCNSS